MGVFIPPGVKHGISNTGLEDLVLIVVACPSPTTCPVHRVSPTVGPYL
jgi:oxalate decarboxylase/phosphoglucose isomerase-like protein (cupin superfamily)